MQSCLYEGTVWHRRNEPVTHEFKYRLFMVYLDLEELPRLVGERGLIANRQFAVRSFLRRDHLYRHPESLDDEVRQIVYQQTGFRPRGPIRMLTQLRNFGIYFSPLNLFYVFDAKGERVESLVAEVNNTPWKERHCYVLWQGNGFRMHETMRFSHAKNFHVSPFMGMQQRYRWKLSEPRENLLVQLVSRERHEKIFTACMKLKRRSLDIAQLRRMTVRYPWMTVQITEPFITKP